MGASPAATVELDASRRWDQTATSAVGMVGTGEQDTCEKRADPFWHGDLQATINRKTTIGSI